MSQLIESAGAPGTAPQTAAPAAPETPVAAAPQPEPAKESLAEIIRSQREAREAKTREEARAKDLETQLKETRAEMERVRREQALFDEDPIGYAKNRKWSREQQLFYGQSLLYDLAPDQAPPDFRVQMFEQRQKIKDQEAARAREEAESRHAQESQVQRVQGYVQELDHAITTFQPGSFPESEGWFGEDRSTYVQSLFATANNLAETAAAQGKVADLSAANVARTLEAEVARRLAERDRRASTRKSAAAPTGPSGVQSAESMSTRNMTGAGSPRPPAEDEKERLRRAAEVAFRSR
jgi:hypothetical protein